MFKNFVKLSIFVTAFPALAFGAPASVGRATVNRTMTNGSDSATSSSIRRAATSVIARNAVLNTDTSNRAVADGRSVASRTAVNRATSTRVAGNASPASVSRSAASHSAVGHSVRTTSNARSGANVSRAAASRATAIFNDVSKIGGGYAACRDSYATCMDQFCATANDTYRRCYCSDRFVGFRNMSDSLDAAVNMLADFQNTNLDAVNKTADEVNAMYSASEGEAKIKRDTSESQKMLNDIADLLSGKRNTTSPKKTSTSLGTLDVSGLFSSTSSDSDDPFASGSSVFDAIKSGTSTYTNLSDMEGTELYDNANRQCSAITHDECTGDASFNLARSAYSVMITQDCNLYEKNINAKKETVQNTIRTAEKYLRDARLEEYRAHNSKDVNECMDKVETAMRAATACGPNYEKCMDYTGRYINSTTGEPIYSKALFDLNNLIVLDGSANVLGGDNKPFNDFLDSRKMFATTALDTCRSIADDVWTEFKRSALIQIAQAQDAKIQSVKDSCVETIAECYDTQSGALNQYGDDEINKRTGAMNAIAAHEMCRDSVLACASLYGDPGACEYDDKTKKITQKTGANVGRCGLDSLLAYVNAVDSVRVSKGCEDALRDYVDELCADDTDFNFGYPWGCRGKTRQFLVNDLTAQERELCGVELLASSNGDIASGRSAVPMRNVVRARGGLGENTFDANVAPYVAASDALNTKLNNNIIGIKTDPNNSAVSNLVSRIVDEIANKLDNMLSQQCLEYGGYWLAKGKNGTYVDTVNDDIANSNSMPIKDFYDYVYNGRSDESWGKCVENTILSRCLAQNDTANPDIVYATYDQNTGMCILSDAWHKRACEEWLGGYMSGDVCRVSRSEYDSAYRSQITKAPNTPPSGGNPTPYIPAIDIGDADMGVDDSAPALD